MAFSDKFKAAVFVQFLTRLLKQLPGRIYLIVDGHPVHRSGVVRRFVEQRKQRLRLIRMSDYCLELNPDELPNQDGKTNGLGKSRPTNRTELVATVRCHLHRRWKQPHVIKNPFQEKHVRYAA